MLHAAVVNKVVFLDPLREQPSNSEDWVETGDIFAGGCWYLTLVEDVAFVAQASPRSEN